MSSFQAADQATINTHRDEFGDPVGRYFRADIAKTGQKGRADEVEIAHNQSAGTENGRHMSQLSAVENLAVRKVDVGNGKRTEINELRGPFHE